MLLTLLDGQMAEARRPKLVVISCTGRREGFGVLTQLILFAEGAEVVQITMNRASSHLRSKYGTTLAALNSSKIQ